MSKPEHNETKLSGKFGIAPGREILGELTLSGANTSLYLHDKAEFNTWDIPDRYIEGVLHDLTKVSLIGCITMTGPGRAGREPPDRYYFATLFPHFVVQGETYLAPRDRTIAEASIVIDDASTLFYDFDAFGTVINPRPFIDQIANANKDLIHRKVDTGPEPQILYFSGKRQIFSADTVLGRIFASHNPSQTLIGGPEGVWLKNTIVVSVLFGDPVTFDECIERMLILLPYLGLLIGRPQNPIRLMLRIHHIQEKSTFLEVYWCMRPTRNVLYEGPKPHPGEVLLDPIGRPEEFARVLTNWLSRHDAWRDARSRFFNCFAAQTRYGIDRLVGAANMFDILPDSALPPDIELSDELKAAKESCQQLFSSLPETQERNGVLGALGRIGKNSLKRKIQHRAQLVVAATSGRLSEITTVTNEAVTCRNHYVHGSDARFDYNSDNGMLGFMTDALEFVFAASDLIESGWELNAWSTKGSTMSHPFGRFLVTYQAHLHELKTILRK